MHLDLVDRLAEPGTGAALRLEADEQSGDWVETGRLVTDSGRSYPIVRGIPRFVEGENYSETFGWQWNRFRRTQLDSQNGGTFSRDRFFDETEWSPEQLRGHWVLDAGSGAGRFAEITVETGCRLVCLDYSSAIDAARETLSGRDNVDLVQGSILEPPFKAESFDYVYCIGVAQHTPSPETATEQVVRLTRRGGAYAMTIYARRPWTKLNAKYLIRPITKHLPQEVLLKGIRGVMPVVFPVADRAFKIPVLGRIFQHTWPVAVYPDKLGLSDEDRFEESVLDTLDMLSPAHDHPMTAAEVDAVLERAGAESWRFKTRRPVNVIGIH